MNGGELKNIPSCFCLYLLSNQIRYSFKVRFVMEHKIGDLPLVKLFDNGCLFLIKTVFGQDQDAQVDGLNHLPGPSHALFTQLAAIVRSGSINHHHWSYIGDLHGFFYRIGGGAGFAGNNGNLLLSKCIDQ